MLGVQEVPGSNPGGPTNHNLAMTTVFIAGAGCSRGTLDRDECLRPPIAKDFVTDLKSRVSEWAQEYPEINTVVAHLQKTLLHVGLEELWTCIDLHAKFPAAFPISWAPRGRVVPELKSALVRMYGRSCDDLARKIPTSDDCTVATLAKEIRAGDTLISFNYDTVSSEWSAKALRSLCATART